MHSKSNIASELLNIMNLRDLPSSLYFVCLAGRFCPCLLLGTLACLLILLCHPEVKLQLRGTAPSGHSEIIAEATQQDTAFPLHFPPRTHELQGPSHQLANSQVKLKLFLTWAATGTISFHTCLCHNHAMMVSSLAAASFSGGFWDRPPGRAEQFALYLSLLIHP